MTGTVFWITGLSNSGKTTIGKALYKKLAEIGEQTVMLDGDDLREITGNIFGYTRDDRLNAALFYSKLCEHISKQGISVICSTISLFHQVHQRNREHFPNYIEIFIETELADAVSRDRRNIYSSNMVVGLDIPPEFPKNPDFTINNNQNGNTDHFVEKIVEFYLGNTSKPLYLQEARD